MSGPPSPLVENYLREVGFWHEANIGRGYKLDPKLINVFIERWRPETHTFHLSCEGCTITLEDVQLQLRLSVDGFLRDTFLEPGDDLNEVERIRYARAYILKIIRGYLMLDLSRNLVHLRWLLKLVDFRVASELSWGSVVLSTLYREMCQFTQPSKAKIRGSDDSGSNSGNLDSDNRFLWHVRVPLINYATVEMHRMNRYDHIPTREPIIVPELACQPDYMPWFKIHGKPYFLLKEWRRRKIRDEKK
ncbi:hypothetical protein Golob_003889 [Gossypium lobatum]|uniref:Aminotransferase-like plant mobile domain-containing protein n=1 Tax=Gossypium lobatum TaxID=34289 RepID=A0A7J8MZU9_9ROSI|nr:hypothetical protein [Gossypium lobatum]